MHFPPTNSFTPLSTLPLPHPHLLHPDACNPAMDLLVLLSNAALATSSDSHSKGKGKKKEDAYTKTTVGLWRMTGGSRVWEVEVGGRVGGMAWSEDGLHLSLLCFKYPTLPLSFLAEGDHWFPASATLEHRSVHDGRLVRSLDVTEMMKRAESGKDLADFEAHERWWHLEWDSSGREWSKDEPGSAMMILDSLPRVTPVDPPKPAHILPFAPPTAAARASKPQAPHPRILAFPSLLPSTPAIPPHTLTISSPYGSSSQTLLTGTFPLPSSSSRPSPRLLALARLSDRMAGYIDAVLKGIESMEAAFREGEKQTMIWREEVESCGDQQAMSKTEVHADLFRLLMTGRSGPAVNEWLGNRLTSRTVSKWEDLLDKAFKTIKKVISESITPALERIVLVLEELHGWAKASSAAAPDVMLDAPAVLRAIDLTRGFAMLAEQMRQNAGHEMYAAGEFMKWLKYEITRTTTQDPSHDTMPTPTHDLKLTWSFLVNGFVASPLQRHFPHPADKSPDDLLPPDFITYPTSRPRPLSVVLSETLNRLSSTSSKSYKQHDFASPLHNATEDSIASSHELSNSLDMCPETEVASSPPSSPHSLARPKEVEEAKVERVLELEPGVWANTLLKDLEALVRNALRSDNIVGHGTVEVRDPGWPSLIARRMVQGDIWIAHIPSPSDSPQLWLLHLPVSGSNAASQISLAGFALASSQGEAICHSLSFFDDEELALLLEDPDPDENGQRYLATTDLPSLAPLLRPVSIDSLTPQWTWADLVSHSRASLHQLELKRCRPLTFPSDPVAGKDEVERVGLAVNGRKGRRVACVIQGKGSEVEVFDIDEDEDGGEWSMRQVGEEDEGGDDGMDVEGE